MISSPRCAQAFTALMLRSVSIAPGARRVPSKSRAKALMLLGSAVIDMPSL
jgi:hypothetical protein